MILTFTGTQEGMTGSQYLAVNKLLRIRKPHLQQVHIGGCIGGDQECFEICDALGLLDLVVLWPCYIKSKQGKAVELMRELRPDQVMPEDDPLRRNKEMVSLSTHLLATPFESEEVLRSGTWATIRAAWKRKLVTTIILPDGRFF